MKFVSIRHIFAGAVLLLSGCSDVLELEPAQSISEDLALSTSDNVKRVLLGAYDNLGDQDLYGANILRNAELLGGNGEISWVGTFNGPREIYNKAITTVNPDVSEFWIEAYETINVANNVLSAIDIVDEADRSRVQGEALFLRALLYFDMARFFGDTYEAGGGNTQLAVPIMLSPNDVSKPARNTVEEVYSRVIDDLELAETLLPETNGVYATRWTARALLARVYFQMGDYANARGAADAVIASEEYALVGSYADVFNREENSSEDIFSIQVTSQDGFNTMNTYYSIPAFGGRDGDIEILAGHLALYDDADDERLALHFTGNGAMRTGKWNNQYGNISIIRLAEMYLIRAESNFREGTSVGNDPVDDINIIRNRAEADPFATVTLNDIVLERRRELAHEGFLIHDIKRLQGSFGGYTYDDGRLLFPIPQREREVNANLEQNPAYQ